MSGFQADQSIPVSFTRQQWDHVLNLLARQPFNEVAQLIGDIQRQCQMAEMRGRVPAPAYPPNTSREPPHMPHMPNMPRLVPEDYGPVVTNAG